MLSYVFIGLPFICALNEKNIAKIKFLYLQLGQYCRLISFLDVYSTPFQFVLSSFTFVMFHYWEYEKTYPTF